MQQLLKLKLLQHTKTVALKQLKTPPLSPLPTTTTTATKSMLSPSCSPPAIPPLPPPLTSLPCLQKSGEKIQFAVTPKDPRYYLPATPPRHDEDSATAAEILPYYSPDLSLAPRLDYPGDLLQYPDDDLQYPSEYPGQYRPQYPQEEPRRPSYLSRQDLPYPALYPAGLQDPRLLGEDEEEEEEEAVRSEVDAAREAFRKGLLDEGDYIGDDGQLMMKKGEIAGEEEARKDDKEVDAEGEKQRRIYGERGMVRRKGVAITVGI